MTIGMFDVLSTWLLLLMIILTSNAPNRDEERDPQELKPIVNVLLANAEPDTNWIPLFNGQDLSGWEHMGKGRFVVEEGLLKTEGGLGLLWYTEKKLRDVVIKVVYRNPGGSNSGVFIRIPYPPREGVWKPVHNGYEVQIDDTDDEYHITGVLYSFTKAMAFPAKPGE